MFVLSDGVTQRDNVVGVLVFIANLLKETNSTCVCRRSRVVKQSFLSTILNILLEQNRFLAQMDHTACNVEAVVLSP